MNARVLRPLCADIHPGFLLLASWSAVVLAVGCGGGQVTNDPWQGPPAVVTFELSGGDAKIFVDEAFLGALSEWPGGAVPIPAGEHRLELRRAGFYPHRRDLQVEAGRSYTLHVRMVPHYD